MYPSQLDFLRHVQDECRFIMKCIANKSRDHVIHDEILVRAITRSLEIIGEACKKIDPDFKIKHSEIEWRKISATRDVIIHNYFGIDYDIVWDIISTKIGVLDQQISDILES